MKKYFTSSVLFSKKYFDVYYNQLTKFTGPYLLRNVFILAAKQHSYRIIRELLNSKSIYSEKFYFLQVYIYLLKPYFFIDQQPDSRGSLYQICKSKPIIIALKFVKSYHTVLGYIIVQSYKYDLEHLTEDKHLLDLLHGVYSKHFL